MPKYHYVLTLQWEAPGGKVFAATYAGVTAETPAGRTRPQMYAFIRDEARREYGIPDGVSDAVQYWSLEPEELTPTWGR